MDALEGNGRVTGARKLSAALAAPNEVRGCKLILEAHGTVCGIAAHTQQRHCCARSPEALLRTLIRGIYMCKAAETELDWRLDSSI